MISITKSREFHEVQRQDADVNRRHCDEGVIFYQTLFSEETVSQKTLNISQTKNGKSAE